MPQIPSNPAAPVGLFELRSVEFRKTDDNTYRFSGHAAVFDELSENLGGFREQIKRGAFKDVLGDDVRLLINHDSNLLLARTTSGTLELSEKPEGLYVEADIDTRQSYAADLKIAMERGDMSQMSFAFGSGVDDDWDEDEDGRLIRTIKRFKSLFDVSPVTYPAYPQTDAGFRAADTGVRVIQRLSRGEEVTDEEWAAVDALRSNQPTSDIEVRDDGATVLEPVEEVAVSEERAEVEPDVNGAGMSAAAAKRRLSLLSKSGD